MRHLDELVMFCMKCNVLIATKDNLCPNCLEMVNKRKLFC